MKDQILGYEIRRYYDGVDGNGTCVAVYTVAGCGGQRRAYLRARRRKLALDAGVGGERFYSLFSLRGTIIPDPPQNTVGVPETGEVLQVGSGPCPIH